MLPEAFVITDGSCGNDGRGGYAAIVATPYFGIEMWGCEGNSTNNRMEMMAALKGMQFLPEPHRVSLVSDSAYLLNTLSKRWYERWFDDEGKSSYHRPNIELWHELVDEIQRHEMTYIKVKGHNGHEHNERVDKLAVKARKERFSGSEWLYRNDVH